MLREPKKYIHWHTMTHHSSTLFLVTKAFFTSALFEWYLCCYTFIVLEASSLAGNLTRECLYSSSFTAFFQAANEPLGLVGGGNHYPISIIRTVSKCSLFYSPSPLIDSTLYGYVKTFPLSPANNLKSEVNLSFIGLCLIFETVRGVGELGHTCYGCCCHATHLESAAV